jgi:tetratricopeptide (TPR) repeat protein
MADIHVVQRRPDKSLILLEEAFQIEQRFSTSDEPTPLLSDITYAIAFAHDSQGHTDMAMEWYLKAVKTTTKALGPSDPQVADSYYNMAILHSGKVCG